MTFEEFKDRQTARTPEEVQRDEERRRAARAKLALYRIAKEYEAMPMTRYDSVEALFAAAYAWGASGKAP